jgi:hypothetical protein
MKPEKNKPVLTTIGIDHATNRQIEKLCKRYDFKKGEIVKFAFEYMDKACINLSEPPESAKAELAKINKRQDDIIRFIRHFEEEQLNPMIRATHSIAVRFDDIVKTLESLILSQLKQSQEKHNTLLQILIEQLGKHADVINHQSKQISQLHQQLRQDNKKLLDLIVLYAELAACGVMDGKRKENLKAEINKLTNI